MEAIDRGAEIILGRGTESELLTMKLINEQVLKVTKKEAYRERILGPFLLYATGRLISDSSRNVYFALQLYGYSLFSLAKY